MPEPSADDDDLDVVPLQPADGLDKLVAVAIAAALVPVDRADDAEHDVVGGDAQRRADREASARLGGVRRPVGCVHRPPRAECQCPADHVWSPSDDAGGSPVQHSLVHACGRTEQCAPSGEVRRHRVARGYNVSRAAEDAQRYERRSACEPRSLHDDEVGALAPAPPKHRPRGGALIGTGRTATESARTNSAASGSGTPRRGPSPGWRSTRRRSRRADQSDRGASLQLDRSSAPNVASVPDTEPAFISAVCGICGSTRDQRWSADVGHGGEARSSRSR